MLPDALQTSPYLTAVRPNEPMPVIYVSDTRGPEYPQGPEPAARPRFVTWHDNLDALAALEYAAADPVSTRELAERFGVPVIEDLAQRRWLQDPRELCREYFLRTGQIEITAHCNWGCTYCPVATDPK